MFCKKLCLRKCFEFDPFSTHNETNRLFKSSRLFIIIFKINRMSNLENSMRIKVSEDLAKTAVYHLDFLADVNSAKFSQEIIAKAVYRYEALWLPFYLKKNSNKMYPPLDVAFIWHCHMLSPTQYEKDCMQSFGKVMEYQLFPREARLSNQAKTKPEWEQELNVSFDYESERSVVATTYASFASSFSYNLIEASQRQSSFFYQVSMPHFKKPPFLELALTRYKKFLYLRKSFPSAYIVPCYAIGYACFFVFCLSY